MTVAGIVLAAGGGRRFGTPKALAHFEGQTLVARAVDTLRGGGCAPVIVVLGASAPQVVSETEVDDVTVVVNDAWETGLASSLRAGLAAADTTSASAALVALVDQPFITSLAVTRLVTAFESGAQVAVATYNGHPRNPALFARELWSAVASSASGDEGARMWLRTHPSAVTEVDCGDIAAADDIDTAEDRAQLARRRRR